MRSIQSDAARRPGGSAGRRHQHTADPTARGRITHTDPSSCPTTGDTRTLGATEGTRRGVRGNRVGQNRRKLSVVQRLYVERA